MYHDETMISGALHWRGTPDGEWHAYTAEQLSDKYVKLQMRVHEAMMKLQGEMS